MTQLPETHTRRSPELPRLKETELLFEIQARHVKLLASASNSLPKSCRPVSPGGAEQGYDALHTSSRAAGGQVAHLVLKCYFLPHLVSGLTSHLDIQLYNILKSLTVNLHMENCYLSCHKSIYRKENLERKKNSSTARKAFVFCSVFEMISEISLCFFVFNTIMMWLIPFENRHSHNHDRTISFKEA